MTTGPLAEYLDSPSPAPTPVFSGQNREESEAYPRVVAVLSPRLRVIHGKCGLQWILQVRKSSTRWESIAFCATRQGLLIRIRDHLQNTTLCPLETLVGRHCDPEAWAAIKALPDYYKHLQARVLCYVGVS